MRIYVALVFAACTHDQPPPAAPVKPAPAAPAPVGGDSYGGAGYTAITGTGDISSGFDDSNIYGGLMGNEGSDGGTGGLGLRGGSGSDTGFGTIGHGSGYGVGRGSDGGSKPSVPTVSIGQPHVDGALDKAIIRRYIKRNIHKIQYCYERELLAKPGIEGTISAEFTIGAAGVVTSSSAAGVDPDVSTCVAGVIHDIEFPKPKDGNPVQVAYPFTFRPAGT